MGSFHNPYGFVPSLDRDHVGRGTGVGDGPPPPHDQLLPRHWTGTVTFVLEALTPTLLPEVAETEDSGHKIVRQRTWDAKPYVPGSSLKGMLRAAVEMVTNSRYGQFHHDEPLTYRLTTDDARERIGLRLTWGDEHDWQVQVFPSDAVRKLPRASNPGIDNKHGDRVSLVPIGGDPYRLRITDGEGSREGYVVATGRNIGGKRNERVFVLPEDGDPPTLAPDVAAQVVRRLEQTLHGYDGQHDEDELRDDPTHGAEQWSRHLRPDGRMLDRAGRLRRDVAHVVFAAKGDDGGLAVHRPSPSPVVIGRDTYQLAPEALLPRSLHPPRSLEEFSPAERLFGWVHADAGAADAPSRTAHRGHVRVSTSVLQSNAITAHATPVTLPELSSPKAEHAPFYVVRADGQPAWPARYDAGHALRGRKLYPPDLHAVGQDFTTRFGTQDKTKRNVSVKSWLRPGAQVEVTLRVDNLSSVDLGGLLATLELATTGAFRLGRGRPLGLGTLRVREGSLRVDVADGAWWAQCYRDGRLQDGDPTGDPDLPARLVAGFWQAMADAYGDDIGAGSPWRQSLHVAFHGWPDDLPIHYPKLAGQPRYGAPHHEWFGKNASPGQRQPLPLLHETGGLVELADQ